MFKIGKTSLKRLGGVHPILAAVVIVAMTQKSKHDFGVSEGLRTLERQQKLVQSGASTTMKSMHILQPDGWGHAVDNYPSGYPTVGDIPKGAFYEVSRAMFAAAEQLNIEEMGYYLRWGNDWDRDGIPVDQDPDEHFVDMPHFELRVRR